MGKAINREEAIRRASALIEAHDGRVVPSLEGLVNDRHEWISEFGDCHLEGDARWVVVFANLPPPGAVDSPGCSIVLVDATSGKAKFFDVL
jgi:hypothetical protein